jgi:YidC/Oxa1 family membrane protein insertase
MILKTGWATDPTQLMMQRLMVYGLPFMLLFSGAFFPLGVIIYWVVQNLFSLAQQQWVLRKYPPPPAARDVAAGAGAPRPAGGKAVGDRAAGTSRTGGRRGKGAGGDGKPAEAPAIDGRQLAPKPGAKPVQSKKAPAKRVPPSQNIPPKRKREAPRKG